MKPFGWVGYAFLVVSVVTMLLSSGKPLAR
jgi:hypothetical protein